MKKQWGTFRKTANRLQDELQSRISSRVDGLGENSTHVSRPPGLKGREIGLWYAQRNREKQGKEGGVGKAAPISRLVRYICSLVATSEKMALSQLDLTTFWRAEGQVYIEIS